jgi:hypothetical protein
MMTLLKETNKFKLWIRREKDCYHFKISGILDEDFVVENQNEFNSPQLKLVNIDLEDLRLINSCGIREFIRFLNLFYSGSQINYLNCPVFFTYQLGMISGLITAHRSVYSFMAPYFSESDDEEKLLTFNTGEVKPEDLKTWVSPTGKIFTLDAAIEKFFYFFKLQNSFKK